MEEPVIAAGGQGASPQTIGVTDNDIRKRSQELGLMGKIFGSREHAPINVAGLICLIGMLGMAAAPIFSYPPTFSLGDMEKTLGGFVLAALTFLGGYLGGSKSS